MRVSVEYNVEYSTTTAAPRALLTPDPGAPDLSFLTRDVADGVAILLRHHRSHRGRQPRCHRAIAGTGRQGASRPARRGGRQRAPVAQAAGAPSGPRSRRGDRFLSQVQALSDAGGDPAEGPRLSTTVRSRARRRRRCRPRRARARPGVHGRALRRRDDEGHVAGSQRRLQHLHSEHRRQRACTSRTSACCRRCATGRTPTRSPR